MLSATALALLSTPVPATLSFPPPERVEVSADDAIAAVPVVKETRYGRPERMIVPALGIDRDLIDLGLNPDRTLEVPTDYQDAGWYIHSAIPGEQGPAIIAGHVSSEVGPGIFYGLHLLRPGDVVVIEGKGGTLARFVVERVQRYPKADFPTKAVYGRTKYPGLRLITCGGAFNPDTGHFLDNVIAFARMPFTRPSEGPVNSEVDRAFIELDEPV